MKIGVVSVASSKVGLDELTVKFQIALLKGVTLLCKTFNFFSQTFDGRLHLVDPVLWLSDILIHAHAPSSAFGAA
jgi:hypothetical protein